MRPRLFLVAVLTAPLALTLALAACATGRSLPSYQEEMTKLEADCAARGGILTPSGMQTGRPQADHLCKISGAASRIQNR